MRLLVLHRGWALVTLVALVALVAPRAHAQPPTWDHYKVYRIGPPATSGVPVVLLDQFGVSNHFVTTRQFLANPVQKILIPPPGQSVINDPHLHYTWWKIDDQPVNLTINVTNQFGSQDLHLSLAQWLLPPALKNEQGLPLPVANHYKCYACEGLPVNRQVRLIDQFDTWDATVAVPRFFCTPVEKRIPPAQVFPIIDPDRHYVVYEFTPPDPLVTTAFVIDQFFPQPFTVDTQQSNLLMVPSLKANVTSTGSNTWGRLKTIYR